MKNIVTIPLYLLLLILIQGCSSFSNESQTIETDNGAVFEVKTIGSSLLIFNNGKRLVEIVDSGNSQFIETFANGMSSLTVAYQKDKYEPTSMALALGDPETSRVVVYDSNGRVKQEVVNVKQFLEENAHKSK